MNHFDKIVFIFCQQQNERNSSSHLHGISQSNFPVVQQIAPIPQVAHSSQDGTSSSFKHFLFLRPSSLLKISNLNQNCQIVFRIVIFTVWINLLNFRFFFKKQVETQFTQESMEQLNFITSQAFGDEVMRSMRIAAKHDLEESRMLKMWDCGASNLSRIRRKGNYKDSIRSYGSAVQMRQSPSCPSLPKIRHGHLHGSALDSII